MIRAVSVDIGSPRKTIPDVAKTFSFIGDGTASAVCISTSSILFGGKHVTP